MFCQYPIPPTCYNWESTILCAGSQYCLTSTVHRLNTYNKYASVRHSLVIIYLWMWRWFEKNQPLEKKCKIYMQGVVTGSGYRQCCRFFCLLNHTCLSKLCDISKTLCYLEILRRNSNSQNLPLAKLHCLREPWLLVKSSIHRLGFLLLFPRQPLQVPPRALGFVFPD